MAESVSIQQQNRQEFEELLSRALQIDANHHPEWRLVNLIMQRRARWLLSRTDDLFLSIPEEREWEFPDFLQSNDQFGQKFTGKLTVIREKKSGIRRSLKDSNEIKL